MPSLLELLCECDKPGASQRQDTLPRLWSGTQLRLRGESFLPPPAVPCCCPSAPRARSPSVPLAPWTPYERRRAGQTHHPAARTLAGWPATAVFLTKGTPLTEDTNPLHPRGRPFDRPRAPRGWEGAAVCTARHRILLPPRAQGC